MGSYDGAEVCELVGLFFSAVYLTPTEKKVSDCTETTDLLYSETPQDHKPKESGRASLDTSRTTDSTSPYRRT